MSLKNLFLLLILVTATFAISCTKTCTCTNPNNKITEIEVDPSENCSDRSSTTLGDCS